jgi:DNA-binding transcriptional MerR regulator
MLTIGELAQLAGTTVRAVRHYHRTGLLAEPERDHSGYRRYGAAALVRLLRVRRMRELGLSLERIAELLDSDEPTLHGALDALDAELAAQAERITAQRARLAELRASNPDPELPEPLAVIFAKSAADGTPARALAQEKEVIMIHLAMHPERTDQIVEQYLRSYDRLVQTPGYDDLPQRFDRLADVEADPETVERMAAELAELIRAEHAATGGWADHEPPHPLADALMGDWGARMPRSQRRVMDRAIELVGDLFDGTSPP